MTSKEKNPILTSHPRLVYPWVIWNLCVLINFYAFLLQFGSFDLLLNVQGKISNSETDTFFTPFTISMMIFQILVALLIDKFGPRWISSTFLLIAASGAILLGYSHSSPLKWLGGLFMGLGGTITCVNTLKLISNWFAHQRFPFMVASTFVALLVSVIIGQPLTLLLVKQFGWANFLINLGMAGTLLALVFFFVVRNQPSAVSIQSKWGATFKEILKSRNTYLIALAGAFGIVPWFSSVGFWHHLYYRVAYNMEIGNSSFITFIDYITFGIGALFFLIYARKVGSRKVIMAGGVLASLLVTCLILYAPRFLFSSLIVLTLAGTFFTSTLTLAFTFICENTQFKAVGLTVGIIWVTVTVLRFISNQLITWIIAGTNKAPANELIKYSTTEFQQGLTLMPIFLLLSFICMIFIKETYGKQHT